MQKIILGIGLFVAYSTVFAEDGNFLGNPLSNGNIQLHVASAHGDGCDTCNERNPGIGWRGPGKIAPMVGIYKNSYNSNSYYIGSNAEIALGISTSIIGITGYTKELDAKFLFGELLVAPVVHWKANTKVSPLISYIPSPDGGIALLSINWKY